MHNDEEYVAVKETRSKRHVCRLQCPRKHAWAGGWGGGPEVRAAGESVPAHGRDATLESHVQTCAATAPRAAPDPAGRGTTLRLSPEWHLKNSADSCSSRRSQGQSAVVHGGNALTRADNQELSRLHSRCPGPRPPCSL